MESKKIDIYEISCNEENIKAVRKHVEKKATDDSDGRIWRMLESPRVSYKIKVKEKCRRIVSEGLLK